MLAAAALIACGCGRRTAAERILGDPVLQCIGRVSYSWYLWHWPMLILTPMVVGHPLGLTGRLIVVWLSLVAAVVSFYAVEEPLRHLGRANWPAFGTLFLVSGTVVAACFTLMAFPPSFVGSGSRTTLARADAATPAAFRQMDAAVTAGVQTKAAPRNLTPTPQRAATDLPPADGTNCHADFATITQGPCVYGDPAGTHTVVLFGDSHADMWLGALAGAGTRAHWKVVDWTKSSCPAASITLVNSSLHRTYTECDTWRKQTIARIVATKPDRVLVSSAENIAPAAVSPQQWSQATLTTLKALQPSGAKIDLLQDVPVPAYNLPDCVAAHLDDVRACTFAVSKAYSFPTRHRQLASDVHAAGFAVVDPVGWICTTQRCPAVVGNVLVYRDDTHLTATFSRWLAPRMSAVLAG